jgi:hypothetical protein
MSSQSEPSPLANLIGLGENVLDALRQDQAASKARSLVPKISRAVTFIMLTGGELCDRHLCAASRRAAMTPR